MSLRNLILRRKPGFPREGRVTWIERCADRVGINGWFLRRPPLVIAERENLLISPAQAMVETLAPISPEGFIEEKRVLGQPRRIHMQEIVKDEKLAGRFGGGEFIKLYLAPWDLHFLLFPAPGKVARYEYRSGWAVPLLLFRRGDILNQRLCIEYETDWGFPIGIVLIGSWLVNGIHHAFTEGAACRTGADLGHFKIGSTVVLVFPPGKIEWLCSPGQKLKIGAPLARVRIGG